MTPTAFLVGQGIGSLGGEAGVLQLTVELALRHGASGQLPFAAVVVRDGTVTGAGVNTAVAFPDPTAHGEVVAIRDAAARSGSADLGGSTVYSSCEPCAICRTVAAAAGVAEIVYAADKAFVPATMDGDPDRTSRLIDAVTGVLPWIARRGESGCPTLRSRSFVAYLEAAGR